jgi:cytochrome c oxidase subunit 1
MQRRVPDYAVQFVDFNVWSSIGAFVFFIAQFIFIYNVLVNCCWARKGVKATDRVWEGSHGLEWTVPSPAPYHTFEDPPAIPDSEVTAVHDEPKTAH